MGTPKKEASGRGGQKGKDSFRDFQENTSDAWDDGDDDLITMANVRMSLRDVHHTALQVRRNLRSYESSITVQCSDKGWQIYAKLGVTLFRNDLTVWF